MIDLNTKLTFWWVWSKHNPLEALYDTRFVFSEPVKKEILQLKVNNLEHREKIGCTMKRSSRPSNETNDGAQPDLYLSTSLKKCLEHFGQPTMNKNHSNNYSA